MMRITYILAILVSLFFGLMIFDYIVRVHDARQDALLEMMNHYSDGGDSYSSYSSYDDDRDNRLTSEAGLMSLFFFLFFLALQILTFIKLKTKTMKVLTIIATIFMPLTFIAGVYGMNFHPDNSPWNLPELNWYYGYPFSLALMGVTALLFVYYFWRKGWIGQKHNRSDQ